MARIRTIKPEFFRHDGLAELSPLHRLLFAGLWTLADREGRLPDRPVRIKAEVMPYDECDIDAMLWDLAEHDEKFLVRYEVAGVKVIEITGFAKHQRPHPKDPESEVDGPNSPAALIRSRGIPRKEIVFHGEPGNSTESRGTVGMHDFEKSHAPLSKDSIIQESKDSIIQESKSPRVEESNARAREDAFDAFWTQYPRKVDKPAARRAWKRIRDGDFTAVMRGLEAHQAIAWADCEAEFIPHPATWLNGRRWEDEPTPRLPRGRPDRPRFAGEVTMANVRRAIAQAQADEEREEREARVAAGGGA